MLACLSINWIDLIQIFLIRSLLVYFFEFDFSISKFVTFSISSILLQTIFSKSFRHLIIKFILDLTSSCRRFMREIIDNLQRKILDENKNLLLCAHLSLCASSAKRSLDVVERRSCHHSLLLSCILNIESRIARQITLSASSSAKTELKDLFSWISLSSSWSSWRWSCVVENSSYLLLWACYLCSACNSNIEERYAWRFVWFSRRSTRMKQFLTLFY
jgi:hypothetical protein